MCRYTYKEYACGHLGSLTDLHAVERCPRPPSKPTSQRPIQMPTSHYSGIITVPTSCTLIPDMLCAHCRYPTRAGNDDLHALSAMRARVYSMLSAVKDDHERAEMMRPDKSDSGRGGGGDGLQQRTREEWERAERKTRVQSVLRQLSVLEKRLGTGMHESVHHACFRTPDMEEQAIEDRMRMERNYIP